MNLQEIRKKIDRIDHDLLKLIAERLELGISSRRFKTEIRDEEREKHVMERLDRIGRASGLLRSSFVKDLFSIIIKESRKFQKEGKKLIGFQGEHGAYSELAARGCVPSMVTVPMEHFADVFTGVENGSLDLGIVPIENSLGGSIQEVNELLIDRNINVIGAVRQRISHCLMTVSDTSYRDIKTVFSHPQALSQCRDFLQRHNIEARPYYDTAGAARMLTRQQPPTTGVIASRLCSELYDLEIIKENIQDHTENFTRFLILSQEKSQKKGQKTSIIFWTRHEAGALFQILKIFSEAGYNLTRIESFPCRDNPENSLFFLDFLGESNSGDTAGILKEVEKNAVAFKNLGTYNEEVFS